MIDQILNLVKGQVSESLGGMSGIPEDKKAAVVETTADSLMSGLGKFGGGKMPGASDVNGLSGGVVKALTSKVGLSPQMASTVASTVIPAVMSLMKGKVGGSGGALGGLGGMLGGLFGKK